MPIEPGETLIDGAADAEGFAEAVERHLDARPLPVDEAEVERIVARLEARMAPSRRTRAPLIAAGLLLAATALWATRGVSPQPVPVTEPEPAALHPLDVTDRATLVRRLDQPGAVRFEAASRTLELPPGAVALTSEEVGVAVVLVQRGLVFADGVPVPEDHWAVLFGEGGEQPRELVFRDGEGPPPDRRSGAETSVPRQLRELRWRALPDRTLETLDRLLEDQ